MEAAPALSARPLMDKDSFLENFNQNNWLCETHLCYKAEPLNGDSSIPVDEYKGFLRNQVNCHAEMCLLNLIPSWKLDENQQHRVTCYISWSPCYDCAKELVTFLGKNSHVRLRIFAARLYTVHKYKTGLRELHASGAQVTIMSSKEFEHCWETFVDNKGMPFSPWDDLDKHSETLTKELEDILQEN